MATAVINGHPNFRSRPVEAADTVIEVLAPGTPVTVLGSEGEYLEVQLEDGRKGYVHREFVNITDAVVNTWTHAGRVIVTVAGDDGSEAIVFDAGMTIDADGARDAYGPANSGRDDLSNAGVPGNWWALATDAAGEPVVVDGFYVSTTALQDPKFPAADRRRYVDSAAIPFFVLPSVVRVRYDIGLGDLGYVLNLENGRSSPAIFADIGPVDHLGEGSIALAVALDINADPRAGGVEGGVRYLVFPGSGNGRPLPSAQLNAEADQLLMEWGGLAKLRQVW